MTGQPAGDAIARFYTQHPYPPPIADLDGYRRTWTDHRRREDTLRLWPDGSIGDDRVDLTHLAVVTVDPEDARDFDDAVYCEKRTLGGWRLWVAIADVSHYVRPDSALDEEASHRGNSVYFPEKVVPMLPEALSNGLCSLKPAVDRLAMVCEMELSRTGKPAKYTFYEAVIHSHARLIYDQVAASILLLLVVARQG